MNIKRYLDLIRPKAKPVYRGEGGWPPMVRPIPPPPAPPPPPAAPRPRTEVRLAVVELSQHTCPGCGKSSDWGATRAIPVPFDCDAMLVAECACGSGALQIMVIG